MELFSIIEKGINKIKCNNKAIKRLIKQNDKTHVI